MDRAFDNADQAAFLAISLATNSGDEAFANLMRESAKGTLDDLDVATYALSGIMHKQLRDQLGPIDLTAVNRYLFLVPSSPSAFDRFLEAIGLEPNLTEIYALLDALRSSPQVSSTWGELQLAPPHNGGTGYRPTVDDQYHPPV